MSGASGKLYRWDVFMERPVDLGSLPPSCWFTDFPPLPGEGSRDYFSRVTAGVLIEHYSPKCRKWWRFW